LRYFTQFKYYHEELKMLLYKMKKIYLNKRIFYVKTVGAAGPKEKMKIILKLSEYYK